MVIVNSKVDSLFLLHRLKEKPGQILSATVLKISNVKTIFLGFLYYIPWTKLKLGFDYDLVRKETNYILKFEYAKITIGETIEYSDMSGWYYNMITANEIAYFATDREEMEAGARIIFPYRKMKIAIDGTYKLVQPVESEEMFHKANVSLELIF